MYSLYRHGMSYFHISQLQPAAMAIYNIFNAYPRSCLGHRFIARIALIRIQTTYLDGSDVMCIGQSFLTAYQGGLDLLQVGQSFII